MYKSEYKLNNLRITGISVAETGIFALEVMIRLYLLNFYTDVVGLKAELAGLAISAGIFWDAISDPLMGILSDKTQSSLGKRRPYILAGSIGLALATFIIFNPPFLESNSAKFSYLLLSF
ncbi:MAG: MFS transporter, partial [Leptospiraceae bacterium]|nr:MFS transporter [Leptospiraceae bacterium]